MIWHLSPLLLLIVLNVYFSLSFVSENPQHWHILAFVAVSVFFTLSALAVFIKSGRLKPFETKEMERLPNVALVKTCYNDNPGLIQKTLLSLKKADYPKEMFSVVLLDDSDNAGISHVLREFCAQNGIDYHHRKVRLGFKAGALNNYLSQTKAEFVALFDSDEELADPGFLKENAGFFSEPAVAVVQTNKVAKPVSFFERAASATNEIFYNFVNPISAERGTGSFLGSAALLRKSALDAVGGFPHNLVEDVALSFKLYLAGFRIIHNPKNYVSGRGAQTYAAFMRQHGRYIIGMSGILLFYLSNLAKIKPGHQLFFLFQYLGLYFVSFFQLAYFFYFLSLATQGAFSQTLLLAASAYITEGVLAVCIFSKTAYDSFRLGAYMYALNFSTSINRLSCLVFSFFKKPDFIPTSSVSKAGFFTAILPALSTAIFLYFSFPVSYFSLFGIFAAALSLSHFVFLFYPE